MNKSKIMSKLEEYGANLVSNHNGQEKYKESVYPGNMYIDAYFIGKVDYGFQPRQDWYCCYHVQLKENWMKTFLTLDAIAAWVTGELATRALLRA